MEEVDGWDCGRRWRDMVVGFGCWSLMRILGWLWWFGWMHWCLVQWMVDLRMLDQRAEDFWNGWVVERWD